MCIRCLWLDTDLLHQRDTVSTARQWPHCLDSPFILGGSVFCALSESMGSFRIFTLRTTQYKTIAFWKKWVELRPKAKWGSNFQGNKEEREFQARRTADERAQRRNGPGTRSVGQGECGLRKGWKERRGETFFHTHRLLWILRAREDPEWF